MKQLFKSKHIVSTPSIAGGVSGNESFKKFINDSLTKHFCGDWGNTPKHSEEEKDKVDYPSDWQINDQALKDGSRIMSTFKFPQSIYGEKLGYYSTKITEKSKVWIITDAIDDNGLRLATTVLYPSEY